MGGLLEVFAEIFGGRYEEAQRGTLLEEAAVGRVEEVRSQAFPAEVGMDGKPRELCGVVYGAVEGEPVG